MTRGRRPTPDAIKALKGNPGKRKLLLEGEKGPEGQATVLEMPAFLTSPDERAVFRLISTELVQRRFVRTTDVYGLGRWASYIAQWIRAKKELGRKKLYYETKSKNMSMLRIHPLFQTMAAMERLMVPLEDRLGLNPSARQQIIRGFMNSPGLPPADISEPVSPSPTEQSGVSDQPVPAQAALGFLRDSQTKH